MDSKSKSTSVAFFAFAVLALLTMVSPSAHAQLSGAIFTTKGDGTTVDLNLYDFRSDVYLNGGPQNLNGAGLPVGTYYFQVTDPSGSTLLSTDNAVCRQLVVGLNSDGKGVIQGAAPASVTAGCAHANGTLNPTNGSIPVQLIPFDFTPNAGGEYKAWLIAQTSNTTIDGTDPKVLHFLNSDTKTDNFKVKESEECPNPLDCVEPSGPFISGFKFYDANVNGIFDSNEVGIQHWKIELFGTAADNTTTDAAGQYEFLNLDAGTYGVCEVIPANAPVWVPTTPTSITGITVPPDSENNNFGNVCLGAGGGLTLGFWSSKNGFNTMNDGNSIVSELNLLSGLNLRNANGTDFNPVCYCASGACPPGVPANNPNACTTATAFRSWILSATATNMAYMLSAQLAAMELNVEAGIVSGGAFLFAGAAPTNCTVSGLQGNGFITVNALMTAANSSLGINGDTTAAGDVRNCQEFMKNALDNGNNNLNFVQPSPCDVNYSGSEPSCAP
jgi:SdrD B-like protein